MQTIPNSDRARVERLYKSGLTMKEVGEKLNVSINAVTFFMRKHKIVRRTLKEASAVAFAHKPLSFLVKTNLSQEEHDLKMAAVILYWAEGYKRGKGMIDFANSDPFMIRIFLRFLRQICGVSESKLRVQLYYYANQDLKQLIDFWSKLTTIPKGQFIKPYVRQDFREDKKDRMMFGLIHIRYADKKLWMQLLEWIKEYQINLTT